MGVYGVESEGSIGSDQSKEEGFGNEYPGQDVKIR